MDKILVTITGISAKHPGKAHLAVGEKVVLEKEPTNEGDTDAIKVTHIGSGLEAGYVANNPLTIKNGSKSATDIQSVFEDTIEAIIEEETSVEFATRSASKTRTSKAFIASLVGAEKKQSFTFKVKGSKTTYPAKFKVIQDLKDGKNPVLNIKREDDKLIVYYNAEKAGIVDDVVQDGISDYNEVFAMIENEVIAKATTFVATNYIGTFQISEKEVEEKKETSSVSSVIERIVSEGVDTKSSVTEKYQYLVENKVPTELIMDIFNSYKKLPEEIASKIPNKPDPVFNDYFGAVKKSLVYLMLGENLKFEGDKGCGKNVLITTLAWVMNRPLYEISMNSQIDKTDIQGTKTLNTNDKGHTIVEFDKAPLIEGMEYGGIVNLDEVNTVPPEVLALVNSATDRRKSMTVPGYKKVQADDNFRVILTMNKDYQGTYELNDATNDRFTPVVFPMPESIEELLLHMFPGIKYDVIQKCQQLYSGLRKEVSDGELSSSVITIRGFETVCRTYKYLGLKEVMIDNIANKAQDNDERESIKHQIEDIVG